MSPVVPLKLLKPVMAMSNLVCLVWHTDDIRQEKAQGSQDASPGADPSEAGGLPCS